MCFVWNVCLNQIWSNEIFHNNEHTCFRLNKSFSNSWQQAINYKLYLHYVSLSIPNLMLHSFLHKTRMGHPFLDKTQSFWFRFAFMQQKTVCFHRPYCGWHFALIIYMVLDIEWYETDVCRSTWVQLLLQLFSVFLAIEYSSCFMFAVWTHWWVRSPSRWPTNLYVYVTDHVGI